VKKESLRLKVFNKDNELLKEVRIVEYDTLYVHRTTTITYAVRQLLLDRSVTVFYFSGLNVHGKTTNIDRSNNVQLRIKQVQYHLDEEKSLEVGKHFILGKLKNKRVTLQRYNRKNRLPEIESVIHELKNKLSYVSSITSLESLRGIEGQCAKRYWQVFGTLINNDCPLQFIKRSKRPAENEVNAMLNYGYALLRVEIFSALELHGIDPYIGFIHRERYGRESMALDLMEEFRTIFIDSLVLSIINQKMISKEHFTFTEEGCSLNEKGKKVFLTQYHQRRNKEIYCQTQGKQVPYWQLFHSQALKLAKAINENQNYQPYLAK
jgi:CRISP-associated protein Cas1